MTLSMERIIRGAVIMANKAWIVSGPKPSAPPPPLSLKAAIERQAQQFITSELNPKYIQQPPSDHQPTASYITRIYTQWHGRYCYFCATYAHPSPNALAPTSETRFARLAYTAPEHFNLAYQCHTGSWFETHQGLTWDECLTVISAGGDFCP
jgi:hypothetical protein